MYDFLFSSLYLFKTVNISLVLNSQFALELDYSAFNLHYL